MRRFATLLSLICLCAIQGFSQEWGTRWICHPQASDTAQVWFRKRVKTTAPQEKAFITVASTGRFRLYVNERNVVTDPFLGAIDSLERHIKQYTIDVSRFLEGRETTIAVWYAPTSKRRSDKQLSLEFYGKDQRGKSFYAQADGSWFCKEASSATLGAGREAIDATRYDKLWHSTELKEKDWQRPMDSADTLTLPLQDTSPLYQGIRMSHVLSAVDEVADSTGVTFDFGRSFHGWVRITLRGAKKGERLCFGDHSYVCGGQMDEQAFPRFTITKQRFVKVSGDERFRREQIQNIEGVEVETYPHTHYQY